jgi:hypothetical protein
MTPRSTRDRCRTTCWCRSHPQWLPVGKTYPVNGRIEKEVVEQLLGDVALFDVIQNGFEPLVCKVGAQEVAKHRWKCDNQEIDNDPGRPRVHGLDGLGKVAAEASGIFANLIKLESAEHLDTLQRRIARGDLAF